jgi:hypothetical protein
VSEEIAEAKACESVREENKRLRNEIEMIRKMIQEIEKKGALFIVGEGAPALIEYMQAIDRQLCALERS